MTASPSLAPREIWGGLYSVWCASGLLVGCTACGDPREPGRASIECFTYPTGKPSCVLSPASPAWWGPGLQWAAQLPAPGCGCMASPWPPAGSDSGLVGPISTSKPQVPPGRLKLGGSCPLAPVPSLGAVSPLPWEPSWHMG